MHELVRQQSRAYNLTVACFREVVRGLFDPKDPDLKPTVLRAPIRDFVRSEVWERGGAFRSADCDEWSTRRSGPATRSSGDGRRREKTKRHLAKVRRKIARRRHNWHHMSRSLAGNARAITVEGLNMKRMTRSAKGTVEEPGRMETWKSGTNRVILNTGWTELKRMLDCKAANVIVVPAKNTSRRWNALTP